MSLTESELKRCEKLVGQFIEKHRPPAHLRNELDLAFRISGQSIEIFEIRPAWQKPESKIESAVAKATWVNTTKVWKIYWQRADLKWHRYEPDPEVKSVEEFLKIVERDEFACFFG